MSETAGLTLPNTPAGQFFDPEQGVTLREPETDSPGYWAGAPGAFYDADAGVFYLTYRRRRDHGGESDRGYACFIARSTDGVHFEDIWSVRKEQLRSPSMERFCLRRDGDRWLLYISYVDPADSRWRTDAIEAASPDGFAIDDRKSALTSATTGTEGVKDPFVMRIGPAWLMFASYAAPTAMTAAQRETAHATGDIYATGVTTSPTGLATSLDGIAWDWQGQVLGVGDGWDRYQARIGLVIPSGTGWLAFYDGSADKAENYEERCGLALSLDLTGWLRLTSRAPVLVTAAGASVRYVDSVLTKGTRYFYYEYALPGGGHELRVATVSVPQQDVINT
jgi:hypothetical protein